MILTDVTSTCFRTNVPPSGGMPDLKQIANDKLPFARFYTLEQAPLLTSICIKCKTCTIFNTHYTIHSIHTDITNGAYYRVYNLANNSI